MTVRQRIDQLAAEPPVGDLGYAADQRLVASALLGLQLLADEIDALRAGGLPAQQSAPVAIPDVADVTAISDIVEQLRYLSEQVVRLTATVKASAELPQLAHLSDQVADLTAAVMGTAEEQSEDDEDEDEAEIDESAENFEQKKHKKKKKKDKDKKRSKNFMLE